MIHSALVNPEFSNTCGVEYSRIKSCFHIWCGLEYSRPVSVVQAGTFHSKYVETNS